jgi:hypothetical protein
VYLDRFAARQEERRPATLLSDHLQERGRPETQESVSGLGGRDSQLARAADLRLAVHLDQHLAFKDGEDLIPVVAVQVRNLIGCYGLNLHDQSFESVPRAGDDADLVAPGCEGHR